MVVKEFERRESRSLGRVLLAGSSVALFVIVLLQA
jgi:hypothetical protein